MPKINLDVEQWHTVVETLTMRRDAAAKEIESVEDSDTERDLDIAAHSGLIVADINEILARIEMQSSAA